MHAVAELWLERGGVQTRVATIATKPLTLGRAPTNDIAFPDEMVSWQHASVWTERGAVWVRDLASRNGTFVNGDRLTVPRVLADGDRLSIGPTIDLRLRVATAGDSPPPPRPLLVEDVDMGVQRPLRGDRFVLGSGPGADLHVDGAPVAATLIFPGANEIWLGVGSEDRPLGVEEVFEVGARRFRVRMGDSTRSPTVEAEPDRYAYQLEATLSGPRGPEARLSDLRIERSHRVEADNRAVLLFILGRQVHADMEAGQEAAECGWIGDDEAAVGIWGRAQAGRDVNGLHVLVHRLRRELAEAGFDPWFIEKRRRCIRARLQRVVLR